MKRVEWVDGLKAWAIFLVVLGHAIGAYKTDSFMHQVIYLYHMPLFFMVSGITFYLSTTVAETDGSISFKYLGHRLCNLGVPLFFFMILNICIKPDGDLFYYYNGIWFLLHLGLILSVYFILEKLNLKKMGTILIFCGWIIMGILQLVLVQNSCLVLAKFACEISKWCGYFIMFSLGIYFYTHLEFLQKKSVRRTLLLLFVVVCVIAFASGLQENIALIKIVSGATGGGYTTALFFRRKRIYGIEKVLSAASLEIYLIHNNIIHNGIIVPNVSYANQTVLWVIIYTILLTVLYLFVPVWIYRLEKYLMPLNFIFHPISVLKKRKKDAI